MNHIKLVILVGPSGSGKSTIEELLTKKGYTKTISHTTRPKRDGEIEGESYYFVSKSDFLKMKDTNQFIETVDFAGNYYGLSVQEFLEKAKKKNKKVVLVVEPKGLIQIIDWVNKYNNKDLSSSVIKIEVFPFYLKVSKQEAFKRMSVRGIKNAFERQQKDNIEKVKKEIEEAMPKTFLIEFNTEANSPIFIAEIIDFIINNKHKKG